MSARRLTPQDKKRLSLARDRRNTYGDNDKSSRKNIRRGKQIGQMRRRRGVAQELRISGPVDESMIDETVNRAGNTDAVGRHRLFKKSPDTPLGIVVREQLERRRAAAQLPQARKRKIAPRNAAR